ncbi:ATP-binding protein [Solihabitans fulvus]|uniref:ATP-binding protein n=1 Tax=Solihabitans fulvus TaxID=1892852 RepID=A0A5B2XDL0_9PSEU|nr:ATP-binding protein [Solihabitans fulvus]KAA2261838.1 ATP-binding protein [Solihabitans fulvus]
MNEEQRNALAAVQFSSAVSPDDIWNPLSRHVDGLHQQAVAVIQSAVLAAKRNPHASPLGIVLRGERGVGKTHMLGWLRQWVQANGGAFFLLKLLDKASFWAGAVYGVVSGLVNRGGDQLGSMLVRLTTLIGCSDELGMRLRGTIPVSRQDIDGLVERLRDVDPQVAAECQDTLRALVLYRARGRVSDVGHAYLLLEEGIDESDRRQWGFRTRQRPAQLVLNDLARIFALTGPVVMAIDQIDSVITQSAEGADQDLLADRLADGLMRLREEVRRTILVAACIPQSWELIAGRGVYSAGDRFRVVDLRTAMPDSAVALAIVEQHLAGLYGDIGFAPPYPSWPVLPMAFDSPDLVHFTPRRLLLRVEGHVLSCLSQDQVDELADLSATVPDQPSMSMVAPAALTALDECFARQRADADIMTPLDSGHEDERMVSLLGAALRCYVLEQGGGGQILAIDPPPGAKPALHARLRRTLDEATEDEEHWGFRAIAHNQHTAVLTRLRAARLEAALQQVTPKRHLIVLRNTPFSGGPVTRKALAEFAAAGGLAVPISESDLRTFCALEAMLREPPPDFLPWLETRRPASGSELLNRVLPSAMQAGTNPKPAPTRDDTVVVAGNVPEAAVQPAADHMAGRDDSVPSRDDAEAAIPVGVDVTSGARFAVPLLSLRKHTAVFAGSGSGKTVLLRRLVEEVALGEVSAIVLDTNNDLARLGDRWPSPPAGWWPGDGQRAERYLADTDVVVWTPGREGGRPLVLNPLPDFGEVMDDPDEFRTSIDASVAGLIHRAGLTGRRIAVGRAVLTEALAHFARKGGQGLDLFVQLLRDLPEGTSTIRSAVRLAADMAEGLRAAMINDPVFGGAGDPLDPGVLFTPGPGKRARVSVISFVGLPDDNQRQTFVSQLQLALFAWVKRHPAADRPLGGLLVLDEAQTFVPSRAATASTESTLRLATQARKYGLGMIYATQAPKALHNLVAGNAATQFFGLLNASAQIQAATELARAKGGRVEDISRLPAGRFYCATEGSSFVKIQVPMCLTHHPESALTEEEVLARARAAR